MFLVFCVFVCNLIKRFAKILQKNEFQPENQSINQYIRKARLIYFGLDPNSKNAGNWLRARDIMSTRAKARGGSNNKLLYEPKIE